jgi:membrane associated rhomboid family serine protease
MSTSQPSKPVGLRGRSTIDIVVILFAITVIAVLIGISVLTGMTILSANEHSIDLAPLILAQVQIITSIAGALVGLVAGRAMGKAEAQEQSDK